MAELATDYLIVGAGAVGLAFADTLLDEDPDCHIAIVDRHARPGGHWNDAYPFVALHQPSSTYGVNSMELCPDRVDTHGHNKGMYPLAKHPEILAYYGKLMNERMLPSGRVAYLPLTEYRGHTDNTHQLRGVLSGAGTSVTVRRKLVDATYFKTSVPATHTPGFAIAPGTRFTTPSDLPGLWKQADDLPEHFIVLGGGKTAMDTAVWLREAGVAAERIGWVRPRGRRRTPGRPLTFGTTDVFLGQFGLASLDVLPGKDDLKALALLDPRAAAQLDVPRPSEDASPDEEPLSEGDDATDFFVDHMQQDE